MDLSTSSAIVTGGASGLGRATVEALIARGALVAIVDRDEARGNELAAKLGDRALAIAADVSDPIGIQRAIDAVATRAPLRVAVACAGVGWAARTLDKDGRAHDLDLYRKVIEVNQVGTFNLLRLAAAAMGTSAPSAGGQRGLIVMTASVAAFEGQIGQVAYAASKGAVVAMTLPAARDLARSGVRVMTIAPGTFDTPMLATLPEDARRALAAAIPNPSRLGDPAEYARLVLAIADNEYLNGTVIRLDGALRMAPR